MKARLVVLPRLLLVWTLAHVGLASAHGRLAATTAVLPAEPEQGLGPMLVTTFGLLQPHPEGGWEWQCAEGIGYNEAHDPLVLRGPEGTLVGSPRGLSFSSDGCTWTVPGQLAQDTGVRDLQRLPDGRLIAVGEGAAPGIYVSADFGHTWTALTAPDGLQLTRVRAAPSRPERLYLGGQVQATGAAVLVVSDDAGQTFQTFELSEAGVATLDLLTVSPVEPGTWVASLTGVNGSALVRGRAGGASFETLAQVPTRWRDAHFTEAGETLFASATGTEGLYRISSAAGGAAERLPSPQGNACFSPDGDGGGYVCGTPALDGWAAARVSADGATEALLRWQDIRGPRACGEGSEIARFCEPLWNLQLISLGTDAELEPSPPAGSPAVAEAGAAETNAAGCGCGAGGFTPGGLLVTLGGLIVAQGRAGGRNSRKVRSENPFAKSKTGNRGSTGERSLGAHQAECRARGSQRDPLGASEESPRQQGI